MFEQLAVARGEWGIEGSVSPSFRLTDSSVFLLVQGRMGFLFRGKKRGGSHGCGGLYGHGRRACGLAAESESALRTTFGKSSGGGDTDSFLLEGSHVLFSCHFGVNCAKFFPRLLSTTTSRRLCCWIPLSIRWGDSDTLRNLAAVAQIMDDWRREDPDAAAIDERAVLWKVGEKYSPVPSCSPFPSAPHPHAGGPPGWDGMGTGG